MVKYIPLIIIFPTMLTGVAASWWLWTSKQRRQKNEQERIEAARLQGRLDREANKSPGLEPPKPWSQYDSTR